jgi:hypothetical protein
MPAKRKPTFADIVNEVLATPPAPIDVRAGRFNASGQFFDPSGSVLTRVSSSISPADAARMVAEGALVVFEGCGCGGSAGGCVPQWIAAEKLSGKPAFIKGFGSPTWIDSWSSDASRVVFVHGDVQWGDEL